MTPTPFPLERLAPTLFVLLWSTGWINARFAVTYSDPLTFLVVRHAVTAAAMIPLALVLRAPWPRTPRAIGHALMVGVLLNAAYLGAVWWAIAKGVPSGVSGLIAAVQPILTTMLAPLILGETVRPRQWAGVALGFFGIALVLQPELATIDPGALGAVLVPLGVNVLGMVAVTLGTFYQKRFIPTGHPITTQTLQFAAAFAVTLPFAWMSEEMNFVWNTTTIAVLAWSVIGISFGANTLLLLLVRRGAVSRAAALIYLMPPVVAAQAFLAFGETLTAIQLLGMGVTVAGVALITRQ